MAEADVLHVFADPEGKHGNPVAIILDEGRAYSDNQRLNIARSIGFSEIVFVNSVADRSISTFTQQQEIPFAGHAAVGAAWYIQHILGQEVTTLEGMAGTIYAWVEGELTWVKSDLKSTPPWCIEYLPSVEELEALQGAQDPSQGYAMLWTWMDEAKGTVRARTFAPDWGIPEDEANGSGSIRLACALGRTLEILHGHGSLLFARPEGPGHGAVGGRVASQSKATYASA